MKLTKIQHFMGPAMISAALLMACGGDDGGPSTSINPFISADNQVASPPDRIIIERVVSDGPGWVHIHEDTGGQPGGEIGIAPVPDGESTNVALTLEREVLDGETLYAMLHTDRGVIGTFEFPGPDVPALDNQGFEVTVLFVVNLPQPVTPMISASDQNVSDLSTVVFVAEAASNGPGWIVIHEDDGGSPGAVVGIEHLEHGTHTNVQVVLDRPAMTGERFYAMLHTDGGMIGTFEFPGADGPVDGSNGQALTSAFDVTVEAGTPAVRFLVSAAGNESYIFTGVEPEPYRSFLGNEPDDQTLTLRQGWRYEVVNSVSVAHPFQLTVNGGSPANDVVLLSQSAAGSLEQDQTIDWHDDGDSTVRFTLSASLAQQLTGYRCLFHQVTMRGTVIID